MDKNLRKMKQVLELLASPVVKQITYIGDMSVDELGLDFDDAYLMLKSDNFKQLGQKEKKILNTLNKFLDKMSEHPNLWTKNALTVSPEWEKIRELAQKLLSSPNFK